MGLEILEARLAQRFFAGMARKTANALVDEMSATVSRLAAREGRTLEGDELARATTAFLSRSQEAGAVLTKHPNMNVFYMRNVGADGAVANEINRLSPTELENLIKNQYNGNPPAAFKDVLNAAENLPENLKAFAKPEPAAPVNAPERGQSVLVDGKLVSREEADALRAAKADAAPAARAADAPVKAPERGTSRIVNGQAVSSSEAQARAEAAAEAARKARAADPMRADIPATEGPGGRRLGRQAPVQEPAPADPNFGKPTGERSRSIMRNGKPIPRDQIDALDTNRADALRSIDRANPLSTRAHFPATQGPGGRAVGPHVPAARSVEPPKPPSAEGAAELNAPGTRGASSNGRGARSARRSSTVGEPEHGFVTGPDGERTPITTYTIRGRDGDLSRVRPGAAGRGVPSRGAHRDADYTSDVLHGVSEPAGGRRSIDPLGRDAARGGDPLDRARPPRAQPDAVDPEVAPPPADRRGITPARGVALATLGLVAGAGAFAVGKKLVDRARSNPEASRPTTVADVDGGGAGRPDARPSAPPAPTQPAPAREYVEGTGREAFLDRVKTDHPKDKKITAAALKKAGQNYDRSVTQAEKAVKELGFENGLSEAAKYAAGTLGGTRFGYLAALDKHDVDGSLSSVAADLKDPEKRKALEEAKPDLIKDLASVAKTTGRIHTKDGEPNWNAIADTIGNARYAGLLGPKDADKQTAGSVLEGAIKNPNLKTVEPPATESDPDPRWRDPNSRRGSAPAPGRH